MDAALRCGDPITMPEVGAFEYVWQAFLEMGPVTLTAEGDEPVSWAEAHAFALATRLVTEGWEIALLHRMSRDYLIERQTRTDALDMSPLEQEQNENG